MNKVLCYPLSPVSAPLATSDGCMRKNTKSALYKAALSDLEEVGIDDIPPDCDVYIIDLAAYVRTVATQYKTVRDISDKLLASIPAQYSTIYVVADTYRDVSIKSSCRQSRGCGMRYALKNPDMLIPYNIEDFLSDGENKENLFGLIRRSLEEHLQLNRIVYFCFYSCTRITKQKSYIDESLISDHEEADTKLVAYAKKASNFAGGIMIRSPSADIDIAVLLASHNFSCNIYLDNGTQKNRRIFDMSDVNMSDRSKAALIGVHAFSGNDYVSCFFRKGKKSCWNTCMKNDNFITAFENLGISYQLAPEVLENLEKFVCALYGQRKANGVDEARSKIFWDRYLKKGKIVELSMLPPCSGNLLFHARRSNYVAYIFRHATELCMNLETHVEHGWNAGAESVWLSECLPANYNDLLISNNDESSDSEDEDNHEEDDYDVDVEDFD